MDEKGCGMFLDKFPYVTLTIIKSAAGGSLHGGNLGAITCDLLASANGDRGGAPRVHTREATVDDDEGKRCDL